MKIAIKTRTVTKDYDWYWNSAADSSFKRSADAVWLKWHNEVFDGAWFGLTNQAGKMYFLAGKIPTKRCDRSHRNIVDIVVMQPETDAEREQLARLTSDLLKKYQDINDVDSTFDKWADDISVSMAEKGSHDYTPFPILETSLSSESGKSIGKFEYPLNSQTERDNVANALGSLLEKDFLIGCIQYDVEDFRNDVRDILSKDMEIAIFSSKTENKEKVEIPFSLSILLNSLKNLSNDILKTVSNPLAIGLLFIILFATFYLGYQNSQKATLIQNLNNQISSLEAALEKATNELQAKKAEIEELKKQINSSKELPTAPQDSPAQDSGNSVE